MLFRASLYLRTVIVSTILAAIYGVVAAFAYYIGAPPSLIAAGTLVIIILQYYFGVRGALSNANAEKLDRSENEELYALADQISENLDMDTPTLYIGDIPGPNAFATGRRGNGHVVLSPGLTTLLSTDELAGILAHEIAHLKHRDSIVMVLANSVARLVGLAADWALQYAYGGRVRRGGVAHNAYRASQALGWVFVYALSRHREYIADRAAADALGTGGPIADALIRMQEMVTRPSGHSSIEALCVIGPSSGTFDTHPPMEQRIKRLRSYASSEESGASSADD